MPTKRDVLEQLKRDELLATADRFGLDVPDRRVRGDLVDVLAGSRKAGLAGILEDLSRIRLKEICRALDLDDSGREKAALITRLAGRDGHVPSTKPELKPAPAPRSSRPSTALAPGQLTREALERHLWSAADILRGSIDSSDYKNYILGLLFLKRLSDRFEEECEVIRAEGGDPDDPDEHQFYVPPAARWERLEKVASNLGEELNMATEALEEWNSKLQGVLHGIDFNDEHKLGDVRQRDQVLGDLLVHFSGIDLSNASLSEPDMLGRAYEYLIERFADDAGKKGGEFYTPHQVVRLMMEILQPREGMRICDPTCGSGGMLIQCAQHVQRNGGDPRNLSLYGQEKNLGTWAICKMNMLLHGLDHEIMKGDTIREPKLLDEDGNLRQFDLVIANPPFSLDNWGREVAENDSYRRFRHGLPPRSLGDLAFLQHMVATLNTNGRLAIVMPHGVLFRGGSERDIRKSLIDEDLIDTVIGLPQNLFYGTGIPASIIVIKRNKDAGRSGNILFIDASCNFAPGVNQNQLRQEDIQKISQIVTQHAEEHGFSKIVALPDLEDYNLSISRYVSSSAPDQSVDPAAAIWVLREAEAARDLARARLEGFLRELGYAES
jgi:type I restriction enzyme M protein